MNRHIPAILAIALVTPTLSWAACDVKSGPKTTALVELYTSEGCSSCPPADKRLSELRSHASSLEQVVPLSLHVDYWDSIGWKEPFAQPQFSQRQDWLVHANGHRTVFTPHFFVSGIEVRNWRSDLSDELKSVSGQAARAAVRVRAEFGRSDTLSIAASAAAPASNDPLALFVAVTEDGLVSKVSAGENRGATLSHDHVVREWIGPASLENGHINLERTVVTRSNWNRAQLGVVGFVQNTRTGQVLQAVGGYQCLRS